jgi:hypothetical protein
MKTIKRYIPKLVYDEIQKLDFKNKEHLYIICDMLYRISIYKKESKDYSNDFIDIPKYYFRDIICDSTSLSKSINILKESNIILCDNNYSKNSGKALGYRFNNDLLSIIIPVEICSKTISKRIIQNKNERNNLVNDKYKLYKDYFLSTFNIDYDNALSYLNNWYNSSISILNSSLCGRNFNNEWIKIVNKYNHIAMSINAINDGYLFFRRNPTNGRIDTNLTSLKSDYKQFITIPNLYQIDIVNSQPFILSLYLNSSLCGRNINKQELQKYSDWTSDGIFYEMFEKEYFNKTSKTLKRKEIKDIMFCIFYSKNESYQKEKNIFKTIFPTIMCFIENEKKDKHNEFAIKLQKMESEICIDIICEELNKLGIKYYTIHDSWIIDKSNIKEVEKIVYKMFYKHFIRKPELKIEEINNKIKTIKYEKI